MRIPLSWLKDYIDITVSVKELAERLTLAGLEVETIEYIGLPGAELPWDPEKIVVGELRAVHYHPNADRLVLAEVEYGGPEREVVVAGPPSLLEMRGQKDLHLKVAFAMQGARLYDGHAEGWRIMKLKKVKVRGVSSRAMVCSEKELGLSDEHEDIIYLPDDAPVGTPLAEYLGDAVLELDIKGPFGHLYSILGIAREAAALLDLPLRKDAFDLTSPPGLGGTEGGHHPAELTPTPDFLELEIADPDLCPRYSAAFIRGVKVKPSPFWMQMRLRRAGMRPINNIVDITNYVMLESGQPLHAFDYHVLRPRPALSRRPELVEGDVEGPGDDRPAIIVRRAHPGEQMETLDGELRTFDQEMLLITDGGGPVAVAGVMGGLDSEVTEATADVLLEAANFNFLNVRRTSRLLGLTSDASQRFGRRVDPELTVKAAARAAHLMAELGSGSVVPVIGDLYPGRQPQRVVVFDPAYAARVLGVEIPTDEIVRILTSLEFQVSGLDDGGEPETLKPETLNVTVPSLRLDVTRPVDLVEEVGRIWGYDRFPTTLLRDELPPQRANPRLEGAERVRDLLADCGLDEVITYSLVNIEDEGKLRPQGPASSPPKSGGTARLSSPKSEGGLRVLNPLSAERVYLRQTLLPSLLHTTRENLRFLDRVAVFEIGAVYLPVEGPSGLARPLPNEPLCLGMVMTGPRETRSWLGGQDSTPMGFYDLKGVLETLLAGLGLEGMFEPGDHPAFHPGRCAQVSVGGGVVGVMGELHPLVLEAFDLPAQPVGALEFDLEVLLAQAIAVGKVRTMQPIPRFPSVSQDLAVIVDEDLPAHVLEEAIVEAGGRLLRRAEIFDLYRGEQISPGKKSLAYSLTYQAKDRTLTDDEVAKVQKRIVRHLAQELGAELRA